MSVSLLVDLLPYKNKINIKIFHLELEISLNLLDFSKEVCQLPDWQTYKKSELFGTSLPTSQECLPKIPERYLIQTQRYPFGKEVSKQTDWQTYMKFRIIWNKCKNIPWIPPKNFRKISHTEPEISLYLSNFSKKVSQLTDWQTYKKFRIIWN